MFYLNKYLWHYLEMSIIKKFLGLLKKLMYIVLAFILIMFIWAQFYDYEADMLSMMSEDEKKEYYQKMDEKNAAAKLANEKKEAADRLDYCQTASHARIRQAIKNSLKDPSSFKEIGHKYYTNAIELSYTATNGFGGRVQEAYRYHYDPDVCGTNTKVEKIR